MLFNMNKYTHTYIYLNELQKTAGISFPGLLKAIAPAIQGASAAAKPAVSQAASQVGTPILRNSEDWLAGLLPQMPDKTLPRGYRSILSIPTPRKPVVPEAAHIYSNDWF